MLPALAEDAGGAGVPQGGAAAEEPGGVRLGAGHRVRVDEAAGAVRALLQGHQHAGALRPGGHRLRRAPPDEAHDRGAQQAGHALGPHLRDEHGGARRGEDILQVRRRHRQVLPGLRLRRRGGGGEEGRRGGKPERRPEGGGGSLIGEIQLKPSNLQLIIVLIISVLINYVRCL